MSGYGLARRRAPRGLFVLGALLLVCMLGATGLVIRELYADALSDAGRGTANLGVVLSEHTARSLQSVDMVVQEIRQRVESGGPFHAGVDEAGGLAMHRLLASYAAQTPQVDAFVFIGPEGRVLSSSRQYPTPEIIADDRDYFVHLRDNPADHIFISRPILSRGGGSMSIFLARRVSGADGQFQGVVIGSMHLRYFNSFYKDIGLPQAFSITLLRRDGVVLTRYPLLPGQLDSLMPRNSPWYQRVAAGGGGYLSPGFLGSGERFVSVHPVRDYPVVVDVSVSYEAALAGWWRQTAMLVAGALAAFLGAVLLGRALMLQMRAMEQAHSDEAERAGELEHLKQKLEQESQLLAMTLEQMDQGLMMVGADGRVEICNHRAEAMLDLPAELMARRPLFQEVLDYQVEQGEFSATDTRLRGQINAGGLLSVPQTYERERPCGTVLEVRSVPLAGGGVVRTFADITQRKRSEERVRFLAHHDGLTRLLNRARFGDRLDEAVAGRGAEPGGFALFYLDLDHFKEVNDTYGHPVGDRLLQTVSSRLLATVRDGDAVARMGGDEFCIIAHDIGSAEVAGVLAERLLRNVIAPYDIDAIRVRIGLSIGIALFPSHGETAEALMRQADMALYRVKQSGRNMWRVAEVEMVEGSGVA